MERTGFFLISITFLFVRYYCNYSMAAEQTNITTDQSALLAFTSCITDDPQGLLASNWSATTSVCNWIGVACSARHLRVAVLNLSYMDLTGTIPPHIGNLSFLIELHLRNNSFRGRLPDELAGLRRLKLISLEYNNFQGDIPSWLGFLPKLQSLLLYGNKFSGSIPNSIFNLSSLEIINLNNNQLSGSIPREMGNLTTVRLLYLDYNNFKEIPKEITKIQQLQVFSVRYNGLKGPVPLFLFNMSSLTDLGLTGNSLKGSLPHNICQNLPRIQGLYLSVNQFSGPIPSKLWQCKQLLKLCLSYNNFSGTIPRNIGNLTQLTQISLRFNNLTGIIPNEIGDLHNLEILSLAFNKLNGHIPSTIFNISAIRIISLTGNQLSGRLPPSTDLAVPNLEGLYLSKNNIIGTIPSSISNASKLIYIVMACNSFSGFIPNAFHTLRNLQRLNLGRNNLTLEKTTTSELGILSSLAQFQGLRRLLLFDNPLNTRLKLPNSLGNLSTSLQYIDIGNCKLWGKIPEEIGNFSSLLSLNLHHNRLSGQIPTSVGRLQKLQGLYLNDNNLQGSIPSELCQGKSLYDLFLDDNKLSGSIPLCMENLGTLRSLSMASNGLASSIPSTLWSLTYILHINLSSNSLTGSIPMDIKNLKVVIDIDLSGNQLSGNIPSSIGDLQDLDGLFLARNNLQGSIPDVFVNLLSIERLDLSKNNLSGEIPKSLEKLLHLKYLNLSFNMLQGEIPASGPFDNFSAQSFMGNKALCGAPRLQVPKCKRAGHEKSLKASALIMKYILPAVFSTIVLVALALIFLVLYRRRNLKLAVEGTILPHLAWRRFSYQELLKATDGFSEGNLLGIGSFGSVYRGTLPDGMVIAVKVFNLQIEEAAKSFDAECEVLCSIRHRNLIKVIGSCSNSIDFKALILDYMPNKSLEKWLYSKSCNLNILQRLNIMIDVASALEYLHHGYSIPVVHCDVKPSNVLLDRDMVAHVADFGISRLLGGGDSMTQTMTLATVGYMAPEYGLEGIVSRKGDVYSYGIMLMETFTRKKPTDEMFVGEMSLKRWIANSFPHAITQVIDSNLLNLTKGEHLTAEMYCLCSIMKLGLACCAMLPEERITMNNLVARLNKIKTKFVSEIGLV